MAALKECEWDKSIDSEMASYMDFLVEVIETKGPSRKVAVPSIVTYIIYR